MHRALPILRGDATLRAALHGDRPARLVTLKLKLVDGCNLRCAMCDYWRGERAGELSTDEVYAILGDARALGCEKVHFTGGELFLRRDAVALVARASELGMRANLTTNGTLLTADTVRALCAIPVRSVTLSIDSPIARIHDEVRGQDAAYARTVKGLDRLLARRKPKTKIRLNTVVSTATYRSLIEMVPFLRARGGSIDGWKLLPIDPWTTKSMALGLAEIRDYTRTIAPALAELAIPGFDPFVYGRDEAAWAQAARGEHARGAYEDRPCYAPWLHLLVDSRGDAYPCCAGHGRLPRLGNTREARLGEIFAGEAATAFRRDMLRARPALCATCDDFLVENAAIHEVVS